MVTREGWAGARDFFLAFKEGCQNAGKKETFQRLSSWAQNNGEEALARVAGKFAGSAEAAEVDFNRMCKNERGRKAWKNYTGTKKQ